MVEFSRREILGASGSLLTSGLSGCFGPQHKDPPDPGVEMDSQWFTPKSIEIEVGETVTWGNKMPIGHTVTAYEKRIPDDAAFFASCGDFESEQEARQFNYQSYDYLREGDYYSHTFETPGVYDYYCIPHEFSQMVGRVIVADESGKLPTLPEQAEPETDHVIRIVEDETRPFQPESLTIEAGDSVGWVNEILIAHSVTAFEDEIPLEADYFASGGFESEDAAREDWQGPREGEILPQEPFTHTFEAPGEYQYGSLIDYDASHITATITVE